MFLVCSNGGEEVTSAWQVGLCSPRQSTKEWVSPFRQEGEVEACFCPSLRITFGSLCKLFSFFCLKETKQACCKEREGNMGEGAGKRAEGTCRGAGGSLVVA